MEFVEVVGVTFPVGVEFTRRTLLRLFQTVQAVEDLVVDVNGGRAMVLFAESAAAQEALVVLDGVALFGCTLSLKIAPPPLSPVPGFVVSMRPSRFLLIRNSPYLVVVVKLKHVGGIESVTSAGVNCCFVVAKSIDDAAEATSLVKHHVNRWGTVVSVSFLRKL